MTDLVYTSTPEDTSYGLFSHKTETVEIEDDKGTRQIPVKDYYLVEAIADDSTVTIFFELWDTDASDWIVGFLELERAESFLPLLQAAISKSRDYLSKIRPKTGNPGTDIPETGKYIHHRQVAPEQFLKDTFRTVPISHTKLKGGKWDKEGVKAVVGKRKRSGEWEVQSILEPK